MVAPRPAPPRSRRRGLGDRPTPYPPSPPADRKTESEDGAGQPISALAGSRAGGTFEAQGALGGVHAHAGVAPSGSPRWARLIQPLAVAGDLPRLRFRSH